jgi:opacity protein-like surface antigen
MKKWIPVLVLAALFNTAAWAQDAEVAANSGAQSGTFEEAHSPYYGELGLTTLRGSSAVATNGKFKPKMLRGVLGKPLTPWLNGELMLGIGLDSSKVLPPAPATNLADGEVKTLLGLYATPTMHFGNGARVYGRLGWANITYSDIPLTGAGPLQTQGLYRKHDSLSWGVGASFPVSPSFSVGADYMSYYKRKGEKLDGLTLNLGYKF